MAQDPPAMAHDPQPHEIRIIPPFIKQWALRIGKLMPDAEKWETDQGLLQNQLRRIRFLPHRRRQHSTTENLWILTSAVNQLGRRIQSFQDARQQLIHYIQHTEWNKQRFQYFRGFDISDVDAAAVLAPLLTEVRLPSPVLVANLDNEPTDEFYVVANTKHIEVIAHHFGP